MKRVVFAAWMVIAAALCAADEAPKPAAIGTQDVPPVPASLVARLSQYQNVRTASFAGWSPDGRGMLVRTRFGNAPQLHRVYVPGGRREQVTFLNEPVEGTFIPKAFEGSILFSLNSGGSENYQLVFLDRQRFRSTLLTDGKSRNRVDTIRDDGQMMIVGSNQRNGRDTDLFLADPRKPGFQRTILEVNNEHWSATDWSRDGKTLLLSRYVSANESYPAVLDVHSGEKRAVALPGPDKTAIGDFEFAPDGKRALLTLDAGSEFKRLALVDLTANGYEWLTTDISADVDSLEVDDERRQIAFTINADGVSQLFVGSFTGEGKFSRRELEVPRGVIGSLEFSPDGKQLGFTLARPSAPADAFSIEVATGKLMQWTDSEVGGLDPESFVTAKPIRFRSFDQREIPAWYYRPKQASGANKAPVLIDIHGGPEGQAQPFFSGTTQFYLNELGVAVILPNVRGSAGYGKTYLRLDNAELREDSVKDIGALLDWIAEQPELDASRVAVTGGSYGGYMVLSSLTHFGQRIKAGIDIVGICNFNTFLANTSPYRVDLRRAEYGDERDPKMKAFFERISPANQSEKIVSALLVAHGKNDPRVPFSEAEQIATKVRAQGRTVWTVFADNEGHGFAKKDNADYLRAVEVLFLKESLGIE